MCILVLKLRSFPGYKLRGDQLQDMHTYPNGLFEKRIYEFTVNILHVHSKQ